MTDLHDYQSEVLERAMAALVEPGASVLVQMPTGSGKSVVGAAAAVEWGGVGGWLTHRRELSEQAADHLHAAGVSVSHMGDRAPRGRCWDRGGMTMLSPQLRTRPAVPQRPGLLIVDEAHHAAAKTWASLIDEWRAAGGRVLGLTATPWRMSRTQGLDGQFTSMVCGPSVLELQGGGWLAAPLTEVPQAAHLDTSGARLASHGDYATDWMAESVGLMLAQRPVLEHWSDRTLMIADKRTLWFCPEVPTAEHLRELIGDGADVLTGTTPKSQRDAMLDDFRSGRLTHLVSVDVLGEGFDVPDAGIVCSLRPTRSLAVWLQQCGRAARRKEPNRYLVLDFAANSLRHGPPDLDRSWSLEPRHRGTGGSSEVPDCMCRTASCGAVMHPSVRRCEMCGAKQWLRCSHCRVLYRWTQLRKATKPRECRHCETHRLRKLDQARRAEWARRSPYNKAARYAPRTGPGRLTIKKVAPAKRRERKETDTDNTQKRA